MDNHLLVQELTAADPGAVEAINDRFADGLFQYCWFVLRNSDAAQVALRDTLIAAQAHIGRLAEPPLLRPWLYALARVECVRLSPSPASDPDVRPAGRAEPGPDPILMAWHAVMDLGPLEREALELSTRQGLDLRGLALVLGIATRDAEMLLLRARESLEQALAGEILANTGQGDCPDLAAMLTHYDGATTAPLRERLVRHAHRCTACGGHLPRNVSARKIYGLLPLAKPPPGMRARTLSCFSDPALSGHRAFVADRAARFGHDGFPFSPAAAVAAAAAAPPRHRTSAHLWVGLAAAVAATAVGISFAIGRLDGLETVAQRILPGSAAPLRHATPASRPAGARGAPATGVQVDRPITATTPFGAISVEGAALRPLPFPSSPARQPPHARAPLSTGRLLVSSGHLDLGATSSASLALTAIGGPVAWSASTSSAELALGSYAGWLARGGKATLVLTVARDGGRSGQAAVIIGPGNLSVLASWTAQSPSSSLSVPPSVSFLPSPPPSRPPSRAAAGRRSRRPFSRPAPAHRAPSALPVAAHSPVARARHGRRQSRSGEARLPDRQDLQADQRGSRQAEQQSRPDQWDEEQPDRWQPLQPDRWQPWQPYQGPWQPDLWQQWRQYLRLQLQEPWQ